MPKRIERHLAEEGEAACVHLVAEPRLEDALRRLGEPRARWARQARFTAAVNEVLLLPPDEDGRIAALAGAGEEDAERPSLAVGAIADKLPAGVWRFDFTFAGEPDPYLASLGWLLSAYRFDLRGGDRSEEPAARLLPPPEVDIARLKQQARAVFEGRDLVNTPANLLGPAGLAARMRALAEEFGAAFQETTEEALRRDFPLVHAVGAAATAGRAPRVCTLEWGETGPLLAIAGKGVCFDAGGLDIKPASAMRLMKKDMGGAAAALVLARMIMAADLPLRLRVMVPAVENVLSGGAFRPGDVLTSRAGLTVEVGNTDAEGRLVLADALCALDEEAPDLLVDFATLTGAARVALGPDLPAAFTPHDALAERLRAAAEAVDDPLWRLPLWRPYMEGLKSPIADLNNIAENGFAGAITAALFLSRFVKRAKRWLHLDIFAWNPQAKPARPKGGEVQAARAVFQLLEEEFGS